MDMHAIDSACKSMMMCICLVGELASMRVYLCTGQYGILSRLPGRPRALFIYVNSKAGLCHRFNESDSAGY